MSFNLECVTFNMDRSEITIEQVCDLMVNRTDKTNVKIQLELGGFNLQMMPGTTRDEILNGYLYLREQVARKESESMGSGGKTIDG